MDIPVSEAEHCLDELVDRAIAGEVIYLVTADGKRGRLRPLVTPAGDPLADLESSEEHPPTG